MAESRSPGPGRRLCIFTRVPEPGRVKRRLVSLLGEAGALAAHRELLDGCLARCVDPSAYRSELWITGGETSHPEIVQRLGRFPLTAHLQDGHDLGASMRLALDQALADGEHGVLIGIDCPPIDRDYVRAAFDALADHDLVLGPAEDGGYGLVGLSRSLPSIFEGIAWGSASVCRETLDRAAAVGARVAVLPAIYDVDRPEDWARYRRALQRESD